MLPIFSRIHVGINPIDDFQNHGMVYDGMDLGFILPAETDNFTW